MDLLKQKKRQIARLTDGLVEEHMDGLTDGMADGMMYRLTV